jgi:hypothetical protein
MAKTKSATRAQKKAQPAPKKEKMKRSKVLESALETAYSEKYRIVTGVSLVMSKKFIKALLAQAIKESLTECTYNLPPDYGQKFLDLAATDEFVAGELEKKRKDGVTDEDLKMWWGISDLERRLLTKLDETNRTGLFLKFINFDRKSREEANALIKKFHPIYGDPDDTSIYRGEDRPLPPELRDRVNRYAAQTAAKSLEEQQEQMDRFSSLNARIRHEIKEGRL